MAKDSLHLAMQSVDDLARGIAAGEDHMPGHRLQVRDADRLGQRRNVREGREARRGRDRERAQLAILDQRQRSTRFGDGGHVAGGDVGVDRLRITR